MRQPIFIEGETVNYYVNTFVNKPWGTTVESELCTGVIKEVIEGFDKDFGVYFTYRLDNYHLEKQEGTLIKFFSSSI